MVEKWSARKTLSRIMVTWGIAAALTAAVRTPAEFYGVRFLLGLAEAGFFPGVIIYLTHWFPSKDRARALSYFLIGTPVAQMTSPKISNALLKIGAAHHAQVLGMQGWQWTSWSRASPRSRSAWSSSSCSRTARGTRGGSRRTSAPLLEGQLEAEKARRAPGRRMTLLQAFGNPKVLLLAFAYLCSTSANYGVEFFLPSILQQRYSLNIDRITWLVILPPILALASQISVGWNSDRTRERRLHAVVPIALGMAGLALVPLTRGNLPLTVAAFMVIVAGIKAYQPAFWSLPSRFLTDVAAAGASGFINSIGNLGGFFGLDYLGGVENLTGSSSGGSMTWPPRWGCARSSSSCLASAGASAGTRPPDAHDGTAATHLTLWSPVTATVSAGESSRKNDQGPGMNGYFSMTRSSIQTPSPGPFGTTRSPFSIASGSRRISSDSGKGYMPAFPGPE